MNHNQLNMKAVQITEPLKIQVVDMEIPAPQEGEVLLSIRYVGFADRI